MISVMLNLNKKNQSKNFESTMVTCEDMAVGGGVYQWVLKLYQGRNSGVS